MDANADVGDCISLALLSDASRVTVSGNTAYVTNINGGLVLIDISDPARPTLIGSVDTPGDANDITVTATMAYVANGNAGFQVTDISNPASPIIIESMDTPGVTPNEAFLTPLSPIPWAAYRLPIP